jgi:hypothetical protein
MTDDKIALLLGAADSTIRDALHVHEPPKFPSDLSARVGGICDLLAKLEEVTTRLDYMTERAPTMWDLGSDDHMPASAHLDAARSALLRATGEIDDAYRLPEYVLRDQDRIALRPALTALARGEGPPVRLAGAMAATSRVNAARAQIQARPGCGTPR